MKITESNLIRLGFTFKHVNSSAHLNRITKKMGGRKITFIIGSGCYNVIHEEYNIELCGKIDIPINVYKCKMENGRHGWVMSYINEGYYCSEIKKVDDILDIAPTLNFNHNIGFTYILESDLGFKIGMTKNIQDRNKIFEVKIPFQWSYKRIFSLERYKDMEKMLHELFESKKIYGEWFNLTEKDLILAEQLYEKLN